jgi:hypothetical protein
MEVKIGKGVGELLFGFSEARVREILGLEDKAFETELGCRRLQFNNEKLELSFEPNKHGLLGWIEVYNPDAILFGYKLIGESREKVLEILALELGQPSECEDYGSFDTVFFDEYCLECQFEFGQLKNLNIGVLYSENDEPLWPMQ